MKREVSRKKTLPVFSIEIGDLELLWGRMLKLFDKPEEVYSSIDVIFPSENLEFKNIAELKEYSELPAKITKFKIWLSQDGRRLSVTSESLLGASGEVTAHAESEAWCAGAIETVNSFMQANKVWYGGLIHMPLGWIFAIFANIPNFAALVLPKDAVISKFALATWLLITISLGMLYWMKGKLFPVSTLVIRKEDNFVRQHVGELSLLVAIVSAILTVFGWFLGK